MPHKYFIWISEQRYDFFLIYARKIGIFWEFGGKAACFLGGLGLLSIPPDGIGFTHLPRSRKQQRFVCRCVMMLYYVVNVSIKHSLYPILSVFPIWYFGILSVFPIWYFGILSVFPINSLQRYCFFWYMQGKSKIFGSLAPKVLVWGLWV